jgi:pilus assembly protein CpaE
LVLDLQVFADDLNRETVSEVLRADPSVVFLDLGQDPSGVGGIQILSQDAPSVSLVVGGPGLSAEGLLAVMRAGATEYLPRPFSEKDAAEAFDRIRRKTKSATSDQPSTPGKVATVFSAKGGTGVTTVATNLAVALRMVTDREVLLVDLAPALGTASLAMGVHPRYTYVDVIQNFHRIDDELFRSFLELNESGVHVLASPLSPVGMDALGEEELHSLIHLCRKHFDYVIVDGGSLLAGHLGPLLHDSDERLLVVTPELSTLRNLKHALDLHGRMNGKAPPQLVLNQYRDGVGISSRDVEDGLGHKITVVLDKEDLKILQSINVGKPEVKSGKSRFAKAMLNLGRRIAGEDQAGRGRQSLLSRFMGSSKSQPSGGKEKM